MSGNSGLAKKKKRNSQLSKGTLHANVAPGCKGQLIKHQGTFSNLERQREEPDLQIVLVLTRSLTEYVA